MKSPLLLSVLIIVFGATSAQSADMPAGYPSSQTVPWSWTGFYAGLHVGGGASLSSFFDPAGASIYGGQVRSPSTLGGAQFGYNWQIANSPFVMGAEADISAMSADGTGTCYASSGLFISANCRVRHDAFGSVTGRLGVALGSNGRSLLYGKGGIAWQREQIGITTNGVYPEISTSASSTRVGWIVGGGIERALTPAWSVKVEYDYAKFGSVNVTTPASYVQVFPPLPFYSATPGRTSGVSLDTQSLKLGVNLKIGQDPYARWEPSSTDYHLRGTSDQYAGATAEVGVRTWYSTGKYQKDLGATTNSGQQNLLVSRLTYDTTSASGEVFGRAENDTNVFLKGFVGGGTHLNGKMNDEDWLIFGQTVPYSNTLSDPVKGNLQYLTADFGYAAFHGRSSTVGAFIGYNYFKEKKSAYGCKQIANNNSDCVPSLPSTILGITEDDTWQSLRLGVNASFTVFSKLTLTVDAAYLPYVNFTGVDNHLLRNLPNTVSPSTGKGKGTQLEALASYDVGHSISIGAGARYWAMWATADANTNIFGTDCPCQTLPSRTERFGGFIQASYKLGDVKE